MTIPIKIISEKDFEDVAGQEDVWDSIAVPWGKYVVKKIPVVEEFLSGKKGKVVDLGCGSGRNIIASEGLKYWCVDFSSGQLMHARSYAEDEGIDAKFFKMSVDKLSKKEFKNEMFDYCLFIATLHCVGSKEGRLRALKEFYRVLKKGGEGLISVWNSSDKRFDFVGNHGGIYMSWREDGVSYMRYYYLYSEEELLGLLREVGFEIKEVYGGEGVSGGGERDRFMKKNLVVRVRK
mgnify:CR=1 FL=1